MQASATSLYGLIRDENGATVIEYALIAGVLGIALVLIMNTFSSDVSAQYNQIADLFTQI